MYNYSLPSSLKAWIDNIHVPAVTAPFDIDTQPLAGRPAVIVTSRGASYDSGSPTDGWDHEIPALRLILGTALGMDVTVIETNLTLAETVPALAAQIDRSRSELVQAHEQASALGARLGGAVTI
jgi:FMN-dependent NADH-azoreductase